MHLVKEKTNRKIKNIEIDYEQLIELIETHQVYIGNNTELIYDDVTGDICAFRYDEKYKNGECIDEGYIYKIKMNVDWQ